MKCSVGLNMCSYFSGIRGAARDLCWISHEVLWKGSVE